MKIYSLYKNIKLVGYRFIFSLPNMAIGFLKDRSKPIFCNEVVNNLDKYGLHVFKDYINEKNIKQLNYELNRLFKLTPPCIEGQDNNRVYSIGLVSKKLEFYTDQVLRYVKQYLNTDDVRIEISYFQKSTPQKNINNILGGDFHVDDNKANLKYFIYLTDVTKANGPFSAVLGTSRWRLKWSFLRGVLWALTEKRYFLYNFMLDKEFCEKNERPILGLKGTHFIVDTTSVHRALPVLAGERRVVVVSFNRK